MIVVNVCGIYDDQYLCGVIHSYNVCVCVYLLPTPPPPLLVLTYVGWPRCGCGSIGLLSGEPLVSSAHFRVWVAEQREAGTAVASSVSEGSQKQWK